MSTLVVENLQGPSTGTNANTITIPSGQTLDASGGTLVPSTGQVVQEVFNVATGNISTSSGTYVSTGLSVSITPKYADSKLKVTLLSGRNYQAAAGIQMDIALYRDGAAYSGRTRWTSYYGNANTSVHWGAWSCVEYIDANSTSSTTFTVFFKSSSGSSFFNNGASSTDVGCWLIAKEIKQ